MSMYDLIITKVEKNEQFDEQRKQYEQDRRYGNSFGTEPQPEVEIRQLKAQITEEEYQVIRRALIEHWK